MTKIIYMARLRKLHLVAAATIGLLTLLANPLSADDSESVVVSTGQCLVEVPRRNRAVVDELKPVCETEIREIYEALGSKLDASRFPITVRIVTGPEEIIGAAPDGTLPPPWSEAVAFPAHNIIVLSLRNHIGSPIRNLPEVLAHELSHLALRQAIGDRRVPRWFSEGIAIHQSERSAFHRHWLVFSASRRDGLLPLTEIEHYPEQVGNVGLAYAQAADFTSVLLSEGGWLGIRNILRKVADGTSFEDAVQLALGSSLHAMERQWRADMGGRWKLLSLVTSTGAIWGFITALFLTAYLVVKRRKRHRLREMAKEEAALEHAVATVDALAAAALPSAPKSSSLERIPTKIRIDDDIHTLH